MKQWLADLWWSLALLSAVVLLHSFIPGGPPAPFGVPTGADPGNWLALAHETLDRQVMSADVTYPPVFPTLLAALASLLGPLRGLALSGVLSHSVLIIAIYWIARPLGRPFAMGAALLILFAGYQLEAFAWGSYPQLLGTGLAVATLHLSIRYVRVGRTVDLAVVAVVATILFATHRLASGLFVVAVLIGVLHTRWIDRPPTPKRTKRIWVLMLGALTMGGLQLILGAIEAGAGVAPVLNPLDRQLTSSLWLTTREAVVPWVAVGLVSLFGLWYRDWPPTWRPPVSVGAALSISGILGFVLLFEQRVLLWAQIGVVVLAITVAARWAEHLTENRQKGLATAILIVGVSIFGSIVVTGVHSFIQASAWYGLANWENLKALDALRAASRPGDLVVASRGHNGNPVGWWVEGYAQRPSYSGMDVRYAAFPEERRQAMTVNRLFSRELTSESIALLERIGADFVVVDIRGPDGGWLDDAPHVGLEVVHEAQSLVVLRLTDG